MASNHIMNGQHEFLATDGITTNHLYDKLWKLCAGCLFEIPKIGESVYYFPQGHIEQLVSSMDDDLCQFKPIFNIPSKIRCKVLDIKFKVETNTNEVYAKVSLMPDTSEAQFYVPNYNNNIQSINYFTKVLSASDISQNGGLSLIKRHAIECLPPLDMSQPIPSQEIVAKDLHGHEWKFKHSFTGIPQRHLFTSGWTEFSKENKLVAGDSFIFLRGENGESRVGIRKSGHEQGNISSSVISKQSMYHSVIATAQNATTSKCMFVVFYKPRYFGTIVGMGDSSTRWKDSYWRSLKVKWDEAASFPRPDKVSPWEIQVLTPSSRTEIQRKQISSTKGHTKVTMEGVDIEKTVDLTACGGYNQMIGELEKIFGIKGKLHMQNQWKVVFRDKEGELMLFRDDPWLEFCNMVEEIFICSEKDVKM